jgi:hypothetical protein
MRSARSAFAVIVVIACGRHHPAPQQTTTGSPSTNTAQMDSATIERLCVHPDSVRAGRIACVLQDQSQPPERRLPVVPPPR